jgi:hypothetical protein
LKITESRSRARDTDLATCNVAHTHWIGSKLNNSHVTIAFLSSDSRGCCKAESDGQRHEDD